MSHEIRTPMNAIIGLTGMLRRQGAAPAQMARLQQIEASGQHLLALINDILDLSKIEAGRFELHPAPFALRRTVDDVVALVRPQAEARGLRLAYEPGELPPRAVGDATRVRQLLFNYLGNAIKFTEAGTVCLRCRTLEQSGSTLRLRFEVSDTGVGVAPERLPTLFDPFEQADAVRARAAGGTGLGLAINRHLAQLMQGEVGADSVVGEGSTFWCTLVVGAGEAGTGAEKEEADDEDLLPRLRSDYRGLRVLLAEDNAVSAEVAADLLEEAGMAVEVVRDGIEAVERARAGPYDLTLMDMQMPRMDGIAATQAIRSLPGWQARPILALTANVFAGDRRRCLAAGMNDILAKPLRPEELYRALLRWLEPAAVRASPPPAAPAPAGVPDAATDAAQHALQRIAGLPGMDRQRVQAFRPKAANYLALFAAFRATHALSAGALCERVRAHDFVGAAALAHSLAGEAAVLGARGVQQAALALEDALRHGDASAACAQALQADIDELQAALAALVQREAETP